MLKILLFLWMLLVMLTSASAAIMPQNQEAHYSIRETSPLSQHEEQLRWKADSLFKNLAPNVELVWIIGDNSNPEDPISHESYAIISNNKTLARQPTKWLDRNESRCELSSATPTCWISWNPQESVQAFDRLKNEQKQWLEFYSHTSKVQSYQSLQLISSTYGSLMGDIAFQLSLQGIASDEFILWHELAHTITRVTLQKQLNHQSSRNIEAAADIMAIILMNRYGSGIALTPILQARTNVHRFEQETQQRYRQAHLTFVNGAPDARYHTAPIVQKFFQQHQSELWWTAHELTLVWRLDRWLLQN